MRFLWVRERLPPQPVDATHALNLYAGVGVLLHDRLPG